MTIASVWQSAVGLNFSEFAHASVKVPPAFNQSAWLLCARTGATVRVYAQCQARERYNPNKSKHNVYIAGQ